MIQHRPDVDTGEPSIGTLFKDLTDETRTLIRQEMELAKVELSETASRVGRNVAYLAIGGAIAYGGFIILLFFAAAGLYALFALGMSRNVAGWLAPLIVGIVVGVLGYVIIQKGVHALRRTHLTPRQTIESLRENTAWLKDRMKHEERLTYGQKAR